MAEIDILVAEIGSTTTAVNAFNNITGASPVFVGQGVAPTSIEQGDVTVGLYAAIDDLKLKYGGEFTWKRMFAASSAAGGLKMTVHGLVYDMTAKAGKEAALGAGAVIRLVTAGILTKHELKKIAEIKPNIILLAGGVDYGESRTVVANAELFGNCLKENCLSSTVIYAGNIAVADDIKEIFQTFGVKCFVTENVYPNIDQLNIEPTRKIIQSVFEANICNAPGMSKIREVVDGKIMPTPGAVMQAAKVLYEDIGDLMVVDVGGATTDVHSITEAPLKSNTVIAGAEPKAKRTVEGDLGVYINATNLIDIAGIEQIEEIKPIPVSKKEIDFVKTLAEVAVNTAVSRHAGVLKPLYGQTGGRSILIGKDLSNVKWILGTGGALTRIPGGKDILAKLRRKQQTKELLPGLEAVPLIDRDYIMASAGVLSLQYPEAALQIIKNSLR